MDIEDYRQLDWLMPLLDSWRARRYATDELRADQVDVQSLEEWLQCIQSAKVADMFCENVGRRGWVGRTSAVRQ